MIRSIRGSATRQFVEGGRSRFRGLEEPLARRRLASLDGASSLSAFAHLRSVHLHKLKGDRAGFWAVNVNGPWRIVFRFKDGNAYDVEIVDYH